MVNYQCAKKLKKYQIGGESMSVATQETKKIVRSSDRKPRKLKKSQIPYAIILIVIIVAVGLYLESIKQRLGLYLGFGIIFGYILQRSRFCFTAGFRDPCITGGTSVTRAILVACGIASIGYAAVKIAADGNLDMVGVNPIGIPLVIGAILFGIGMVIAGGCASGTLMRVGEGFTMQMISLVFFVAGSVWGAHDVGAFWANLESAESKIFLPDVLGWFGAIIVQILIMVLLYIAAVKWQEKRMGSKE